MRSVAVKPSICAAITATNLSMLHVVGMGGTAHQHGVSILWQNWTGNIALVLSGLIVLPLMLPVAEQFGLDLIWFGVITVVAVEIGLLTPPFGMLLYVTNALVGIPIGVGLIISAFVLTGIYKARPGAAVNAAALLKWKLTVAQDSSYYT